ncbi:probable ATP-dependent RNA helicase DDX28 [Phymastichus coffea]|uniref:probable ATP-dependent RNA helicase DDX28 n=1 Tax=Phymastichus coffea TaxID=108790 RepID=UPI00273B5CB1|nr:probable ATP-dependent RNA helicase DDX28 [Phymastichus coffea]
MLANLAKFCLQTSEQSILQLRVNRFATKLSKVSVEDYTDDDDDYDFEPKHEKESEEPPEVVKKSKRPIIIQCKRSMFNFHEGDTYPKFQPIPLASRAWQHRKSNGDYFTIYPLKEGQEEHELNQSYSFQDLNINEKLLKSLEENNLIHPTSIQKLGIPKILDNHNVILTAETGSGKTYAFLIPILQQVLKWKPMKDRSCNRPLGLILTPSHELTKQIAKVAKKLAKNLEINIVTLTGGKTKRIISNPPITEVDIVVATIGVMKKLVRMGIYKLDEVKHVVLDEADTLFDETFTDYTCNLLRKVQISAERDPNITYPKTAQITLNSATIPQSLSESLYQVADRESFLMITTGNEHLVRVPQKFFRLTGPEKPMSLLKIVKPKVKSKTPIIIFCNTTASCDFISLFLNQFNIKCITLHGKQRLEHRKGKFMEFQQGVCNILTTTDAGARGLDTCKVKSVINFDFPLVTAEYIHRCGRVGRIGSPRDCRVINFISRPLEIILAKKIEFAIRKGKSIPMVDMVHKDKDYEDEFVGANNTKEDFDPDKNESDIEKMSLDTSN